VCSYTLHVGELVCAVYVVCVWGSWSGLRRDVCRCVMRVGSEGAPYAAYVCVLGRVVIEATHGVVV
jgi:hypothetical protein